MPTRNKRIERNALNFLRSLPEDLLSFPLDIYNAILTLDNCKIHSYQFFAKKYDCSLTDVVELCESETGAAHKENNNYIIMFNNSKTIVKERKLFTLAHELGHIQLGHFTFETKSQIAQGNSKHLTEKEANYYAACILCPIPILYKTKPSSAIEIKKTYKLSSEAAEIAWDDYINYNRNYNIAWHNDIINLFHV